MIKRSYSSISVFAWLAIGLLIAFAILCYNFKDMQQIALMYCLPGAFICSILSTTYYKISKCLKLLIFLYLWHVVCTPFAIDMELAYNQLIRLAACFLMIISCYLLVQRPKLTPLLYIVFIILFLNMIIYAKNNILSEDFDISRNRLNDDVLNANTLGYFSFMITFTIYIFPFIINNKIFFKSF